MPPSRYVQPHENRDLRSYAPSMYAAGDDDGVFINETHATLEAEVDEIRGKLEPADHYKLYEMAYFARGPILEIGRLAGKSTTLLALGARDGPAAGHIFSIELDDKLVPTADASLSARGLRELVTFISGDSATAVSELDGSFDLVFVDGDHSFSGVERDMGALRGRVSAGGSIMFHDYFHGGNDDPSNEAYGVRAAVDAGARLNGIAFRGRFGGIALFEQLG